MKKYRVIVDTNLWISLLIGKRLSDLRSLCTSDTVDVYICDELLEEFMRIASREKIRKYTTDERVVQTLDLMKASCISGSVGAGVVSSGLRDVNDLYLLALAETVKADFILTGDKDLLSLQSHRQTKIVTWRAFEAIIEV
jgi:putative PIN family toxin of toxin-antitoxin system